MTEPAVDLPSTDHPVQYIPEGYPSALKITNGSAVDQKVIPVYLGTHRIGRTTVTLDLLAAAPANAITVAPPLPPETVTMIEDDSDLTVVEIP